MRNPADISLTARYTAAAWEAMGLPFSERFADWRGRLLFRSSMAAGSLLPGGVGRALFDGALRPRHLFLDEYIRSHAVEQVVEVAAGYSRRGCTFAGQALRYVEVDRPAVMDEKRRRCSDLSPARRPLFLGIDATRADFVERVLAACDPGLRTVVITEGLSPYFDRASYVQLLGRLADIARPLSAPLLADVYLRGTSGRLLAWWMKVGSTAIAVVADRPHLYLRNDKDIGKVFDEGGFHVKAVYRPAAEARYTGRRRVRHSGWMRIVEAEPR